MLLALLTGECEIDTSVTIETELVVRARTAPPPPRTR